MSPSDEDAWKRYRQREDERDEAEAAEKLKKIEQAGGKQKDLSKRDLDDAAGRLADNVDKVKELMDQAAALIDHIHQLYRMYFVGAEKRPPIEQVKRLEQMMEIITRISRPAPSLQFRVATLRQRYATMKDKWDRDLKNHESGKK